MRRAGLPGALDELLGHGLSCFRRNSGKLQKDYHNYVYERVYCKGRLGGDFGAESGRQMLDPPTAGDGLLPRRSSRTTLGRYWTIAG